MLSITPLVFSRVQHNLQHPNLVIYNKDIAVYSVFDTSEYSYVHCNSYWVMDGGIGTWEQYQAWDPSRIRY